MNKYKEFEDRFSVFLNQEIICVYYQIVNYDYIGFPERDIIKTGFHTIDISVILKLADNNYYEIFWDSTFLSYGIGLKVNKELPSSLENWKILSVHENKDWKNQLNKKIIDVKLIWQILKSQRVYKVLGFEFVLPFYKKEKYPQTLIIKNSIGKIIITVGEENERMNNFHGFSDNILVFFNEILPQKLGYI